MSLRLWRMTGVRFVGGTAAALGWLVLCGLGCTGGKKMAVPADMSGHGFFERLHSFRGECCLQVLGLAGSTPVGIGPTNGFVQGAIEHVGRGGDDFAAAHAIFALDVSFDLAGYDQHILGGFRLGLTGLFRLLGGFLFSHSSGVLRERTNQS